MQQRVQRRIQSRIDPIRDQARLGFTPVGARDGRAGRQDDEFEPVALQQAPHGGAVDGAEFRHRRLVRARHSERRQALDDPFGEVAGEGLADNLLFLLLGELGRLGVGNHP